MTMTPAQNSVSARPKSSYGFWIAVCGAVPSALSIISVTQRTFNIGLQPILLDIVSYYRKLVSPLFGFLPFEIPGWYKDLWLLSAVILLAGLRTLHVHLNADDGEVQKSEPSRVAKWLTLVLLYLPLALVASALLAGFLLLLFILFGWISFYFERGQHAELSPVDYEGKAAADYFLLSILLAVVAAVAFYLTNAAG